MDAQILRNEILDKVREYYEVKFAPRPEFVPGKSKINYAGRVFDHQEMANIVESALDFWLTAGRFHQEFTGMLEDFYDVSDVILTNSGSSANLLAVTALTSPKLGDSRLKPGDEVITVAAGFPATVAPLVQNGLVPVFVDIELSTYNIAAQQIEQALSPKTRAICIAHTLGNPFDLDAVMYWVEKNNLWLIEDNCDALGSRYNGQLTGTFGHVATTSFYPAHHITTGEGGCVVTNDSALARIIRSVRDWGRDCYCEGGENNTCGRRFNQQFGSLPEGYDHKYVYTHLGYNLKMTEMQAAIGVAQMAKLDTFIAQRKRNYRLLFDGLADLQDYFILPVATLKSDPSWFGFLITLKPKVKFSRNQLVEYLELEGIETRNLFAGNLLRHPAFENINMRVAAPLTNTDYSMNNTFFIGTYPGLSDEKISFVIEVFHEFIGKVNS